ncbi:MAG: hypothetical protein ACLFMO_07360 [Eubacteriales bacterium]
MRIRKIIYSSLMIALIVVAQQIKITYVTGILVNAILFCSVYFIGIKYGVIVAIASPFLAHLFGIMPLFIVIPFIAAANTIYCILLTVLKKINIYLSVVVASISKFLFLYVIVNYIITIPAIARAALSLPQLFTALGGGAIGIILYSRLKDTIRL